MKRICLIITALILLTACSAFSPDASLELKLMTDENVELSIGDTALACVYVKHGSSEIDADVLEIKSSRDDIAEATLKELTSASYAYIEISAVGVGETDIFIFAGAENAISIRVCVMSGEEDSNDPEESTTAKPAESTTSKPAESTTAKPAESTTAKPAESTTAKPEESTTAKPAESTTAKPAESTASNPGDAATGIGVIEFTYSVKRGNDAHIKIKGYAGHTYSITVEMKSGYSKAAGLEEKIADGDGYVEWTWRVGGKSSTDFQPIVTVRDIATGESVELRYTVTK